MKVVSRDFNTQMVDRLMAEDALQIDLLSEFEAIIQLRQDLTDEVKELDKEIELLQETRNDIAEPYLAAIQEHEENIRKEVLAREKTFQCSFGQAIYRKGAKSVKWNDDALKGYAVEHPEIEQFRSESEGEPTVVLKVGGRK